MLPTNVAQALVIASAIFVGFTMPITAPQVLWVNMVTSVASVSSFLSSGMSWMSWIDTPEPCGPADPHRFWNLACHLRRTGAPRIYTLGLLLDEIAECLRRARPHCRGQRNYDRAGVLSA